MCESRCGRPGFPDPNSPYGLCGRKATLKSNLSEADISLRISNDIVMTVTRVMTYFKGFEEEF